MIPLLVQLGIFVAAIGLPAQADQADPAAAMPERKFYERLSDAAAKLGIALFVFTPAQFEERTGKLSGYRYSGKRWRTEPCALPDMVYDRSYCVSIEEQMACRSTLSAIRKLKRYITLNGSLPSKWEVYSYLRQDAALARSLPLTQPVVELEQLLPQLKVKSGGLFLKPAAGMQGKGALHIRLHPLTGQWLAVGRTKRNLPIKRAFDDWPALAQWGERFIGPTAYISQPYLELRGRDGKAFDVRALVQKDETGQWALTGTAVRVGSGGSLTSNLHGGGSASDAAEYLADAFGEQMAKRMLNEIERLSLHAAPKLEERFGRLAELGFDFGIEPAGRIWLLEVNSRPGRASLRLLGDKEAERLSIERPLQYARLLSRRLYPTLITNASAISRTYEQHKRLRTDNVQEVHP
ncbi:YheC/YheD family endospore coat-associated protein [Paenibacillus radicis (ex Gao et al. 2016)]|uniref:Endospore coat-associated protein YheC n=1 Tax=Paenibacillus radicis (ex Gao et al. 2016) TaxID=1737354 RepID=A0A917M3P3_9BACL|nr:YheC/YheD family protein [Paenibacillus radicis (ex Gao et al. 2016)]GGG74846.1 endospore coat-associated protein YheC [Paenibacillus radicis (ex Gao et al. 2016)]